MNNPIGTCPKCGCPVYTKEGFCGRCEGLSFINRELDRHGLTYSLMDGWRDAHYARVSEKQVEHDTKTPIIEVYAAIKPFGHPLAF